MKEERTVLIIGGARGLGKYFGRLFYEKGFKVIVASVTARDKLQKEYIDLLDSYYQIDLTKWDETARKIDAILSEYGKIDILVNNAAVRTFKPLDAYSYKEIIDVVMINMISHVLLVRRILPVMKKNGYGRIILISSQSGFYGYPRGTLYCSSKGGMIRFAESLSKELLHLKGDVTVNAVCPGSFSAPFGHLDLSDATRVEKKVVRIGEVILDLVYTKKNGLIIPVLSLRERVRYILEEVIKHFLPIHRAYNHIRYR